MIPVFADTHYFLAIASVRDSSHSKAIGFARSNRRPIVATDWIITELADSLSSVSNRPVFATFVKILEQPTFRIIPFDAKLMNRGLSLFLARPDKEWSLTDCVSLMVMQDLGITEALTGDHHFEQAGFTALLK